MKIRINSKGQIINNSMNEIVYSLGIQQRLWLNKVVSNHGDWLDTLGQGDISILRIHQILRNSAYTKWDKEWLNTLRKMYLESFVYKVKH